MDITEKTYFEALDLLRKNATAFGFVAADKSVTADQMGYRAVFTRDAMMAALAAAVSEDNKLILAGRRSIEILAEAVSSQGQIPYKFDPSTGDKDYGFGNNLESSIWWLITFWIYIDKYNDAELRSKYYSVFQDVIQYLQHHLQNGLLEQGQGTDWQDQMPHSGFSLYTNSLWLIFVYLINSSHRAVIADNFNYFFSRKLSEVKVSADLKRKFKIWRENLDKHSSKSKTLLKSISVYEADTSIDVFGNILACLSEPITSKQKLDIIKELQEIARLSPVPIRIASKPMKVKQSLNADRNHNHAWQFQNAASWPMVGGWWVYLLAKNKKLKLAQIELDSLAAACAQHDWEFNQWFHGRTGKPMGTWRMTHTAASFIIAYKAVVDSKFVI